MRELHEFRDDEADHQQQQGGADVVGAVDLERLVRAGEEEVVRGRRNERGGDSGRPPTARRGEHHDHHEDQCRVHPDDFMAERDQQGRDEQGTEARDREPERLHPVVGSDPNLVAVNVHDHSYTPGSFAGQGSDDFLMRVRELDEP